MSDILVEVRFHGRGGQGVVTAADMLAVAGFKDGYYTLSFPTFGAEKRGTPVASFLRLSDEPIVSRDEIYYPDYVVVMDPTVIGPVKVDAGIKSDGKIIANYPKGPEELKESMGVDVEVYTINATRMAMEHLGRPITNTAMVGAFVGATGIIKIDSVLETVREWFSGELAEKNAKLITEAYNYMKEVCKW
ncbi:pyruvate ferredoxin oxidoreductase, gamma subunit [Archaeoglobus sulfaticallidus PM70-1]|uniref:pyruvate synthase n=1 Tax=Archaeoglobus sulfaticallidus PM70-1 TaxID=387631 RepID=N0BIQ5_9EURY|nr:pyruvate ferredoxin oxidoreductase subunit gamma [Archaeoglobus sulfaticallidus]AGK60356.1 pyruvate ferredoxin oxidoreductase, gamma subunit [Archaeoglobus sulfaticallidus PM70-1]